MGLNIRKLSFSHEKFVSDWLEADQSQWMDSDKNSNKVSDTSPLLMDT